MNVDPLKPTIKTAAEAVAPRDPSRDQDVLRAEAYRKRVQTLADYMNAYPVADWPRFALAIGASLLTAGSAIAATTSLANEADNLAASVLWLGAAVIGAVSLLVLRANQQVREKRYYEARQLFWQWANRVQEPYIVWDSDGVAWPSDL